MYQIITFIFNIFIKKLIMKKHQFLIAAAITGMTLSSCGSSEEEKTLDDTLEQLNNSFDDAAEDMNDAMEDTYEAVEDMSTELEGTSDDNSEWLDSYEEFMLEYIDLTKKSMANPTDMTIAMEAMELATELAEWQSKAEDMELNATDAARLAAISAKMMSAMQ
jgi:outer membrane murein-binding lipoprotein Lpp